MPASGIRCIPILNTDVFGQSEVYVLNVNTLEAAKNPFLQLFKLRMLMCGYGTKAFRGRMSVITARRQVQILASDDLANMPSGPLTIGTPSGNQDGSSDQPKSCVQVRFSSSDGRFRNAFLSGIPDLVIGENPTGPRVLNAPGFVAAFNAYRAYLCGTQSQPSAWGWIGRTIDTNVIKTTPAIQGIQDQTTQLFGVVVPNNSIGTPGSLGVMLRGWKMTSKNIFQANGRWQTLAPVANSPAAGQTTYWLRNSETVNANSVVSVGTIELVDFQFIPFQTCDIIKQTTRDRGNRFLTPPGRRSKRTKVAG